MLDVSGRGNIFGTWPQDGLNVIPSCPQQSPTTTPTSAQFKATWCNVGQMDPTISPCCEDVAPKRPTWPPVKVKVFARFPSVTAKHPARPPLNPHAASLASMEHRTKLHQIKQVMLVPTSVPDGPRLPHVGATWPTLGPTCAIGPPLGSNLDQGERGVERCSTSKGS